MQDCFQRRLFAVAVALVVNCQSALVLRILRCFSQAAISLIKMFLSGMRLSAEDVLDSRAVLHKTAERSGDSLSSPSLMPQGSAHRSLNALIENDDNATAAVPRIVRQSDRFKSRSARNTTSDVPVAGSSPREAVRCNESYPGTQKSRDSCGG